MVKNIKKRLKDQKGLTLIELLAVIVILGIIAAIAIPSIGGIIQKSKEDAIKADGIQIINAAKMHISSTGFEGSDTIELTETELGQYLEGIDLDDDYSVEVILPSNETETQYLLTGSGEAGKKWVNFEDASIDDINKNTDNKVTVDDSKLTKES